MKVTGVNHITLSVNKLLEIHNSTLTNRVQSLKKKLYLGLQIFPESP